MHAMKETAQGWSITRCGKRVKSKEATGWESEVTCVSCNPKKMPRSCAEPSKADTVSVQSRHIDRTRGETRMARNATLTLDRDFVEQVMQLRDTEEKKWDEIAEITGVASGKCMLAHASGTLPKKDLIKNATAADVVRLRDDQALSWGQISVRTMLPESTCRGMYTDASGTSTKGLRIGKGGRHPNGVEGVKRVKSTKAPKKAAAAKATTPAVDLFDGVADEDVNAMLTGFAIKVSSGTGDSEAIKVKSVKKAAKGKVVLVDGTTGESRTIKLAAITAISKRKVL